MGGAAQVACEPPVPAPAIRHHTRNMPMRPSSVVVVAGVVLAGFTVWITRQAKALEQDLDANSQKIALLGKPAPDFHLTSLDGRTISLADYRGKEKLVLVFWATWNNGSHPAMMLLAEMYQRAHTPESDFDIVAIAVDDEQGAVKQFVGDSKIAFPVVLDRNRAITNAYGIRSIPTLLIVDPDGKVTYGSAGFAQGRQNEFAQRLGLRPGAFRLEMRAPNGRGN
jgi:peroxiredoxin